MSAAEARRAHAWERKSPVVSPPSALAPRLGCPFPGSAMGAWLLRCSQDRGAMKGLLPLMSQSPVVTVTEEGTVMESQHICTE